MEHNAIQWSGAPCCRRGGYSFYRSVSSRARPDAPVQVWRLGQFYYVRCGPQDPVCIAEVTLLWEDQARRHLLASARLYFLPEDTPRGRTREHGQDEVLAVSRKMVVRVEDLVRWSCPEPSGWSPPPNGVCRTPTGEPPLTEHPQGPPPPRRPGVTVLSYPQYCRFRSLQRRVALGAAPPLERHLLALGAVRAPPHARVLYCRDTFSHPALETSACFSWQFRCPSLSLRGRPRKRRARDSRDSPPGANESWIDRMKENVQGSVEDGCEAGWLPPPEEQLFLDQLHAFMERRGSPIHKVPNLGFKKIDMFLMYSVVKRLGGYRKVTSDRLWKVVYNELGGCPGSTSAATCTRRHYERLMLPYEDHLRAGGAEFRVPESPSPPRARGMRGRKPHPRGRRPGPKAKDKRAAPNSLPQAVGPNGAVVKRGRGRPPGTRNKAKLLQKNRAGGAGPQGALLTARPRGRPASSSSHRPVGSPLSAPFLSLLPKPDLNLDLNLDLNPDRAQPAAPPPPLAPAASVTTATPPPPGGVLLSSLPRHFVGGALGGFSPVKGVCPLDVFRTHPPPPPPHANNNNAGAGRCSSGCHGDQRGGVAGGARPPPLRLLPLNLDCSVQVCQLMRARHLDPAHLHSFTRRLSEALSGELKPPGAVATEPGAIITTAAIAPTPPPPEQPLNLSKRLDPVGTPPPPTKRGRPGPPEAGLGEPFLGGRGPQGPPPPPEPLRAQEEPADLSSPSRIRAFLLGLPPFQVQLDQDRTRVRFHKFPPPPQEVQEEPGSGPSSGPGPAPSGPDA